MKKTAILSAIVAVLILSLTTCKKHEHEEITPVTDDNVVPENMTIDVPDAISSPTLQARYGESQGDGIKGSEVYKHLRVFINVGEGAADFVKKIMSAIRKHNINKAMSFTFTSNDDQRVKAVRVIQNAVLNSKTWEFKLTMKDADSSMALEIFWDRNPVKGIATVCPKNLNRNETMDTAVHYQVDYTESDSVYEKRMIVSVSGIPKKDNFSMNTLKMFVGKKGDVLDIYGNSNHPDIILIDTTYTGGRNWAFVAHANNAINMGVAKVALPPSSTNTNSSLFSAYSIYKVLESEIKTRYPGADSATIATYLKEAKEPGYFKSPNGYIASGDTIPDASFTQTFVDLSKLKPYIPSEIANLVVKFQK